MKVPFTILLLLSCLVAKTQTPTVENNATEKEKAESILYANLNGKYEFIIGYIEESYWWSNKINYQIIAYQNSIWKIVSVRAKKGENGKIRKPSIETRNVDQNKVKTLISDLTRLSFWKLENEQLNITTRKNPDSTISGFSISDGVNYRFEILSKGKFRIIESYEPEYFLGKLPEIKDREVFLKAKELFEKAISN